MGAQRENSRVALVEVNLSNERSVVAWVSSFGDVTREIVNARRRMAGSHLGKRFDP